MRSRVTFRANNEVALHVSEPQAAEEFYVGVLGCQVTDRNPGFTSLTNGELRLYLIRDPGGTHNAAVPSFDVEDRAKAIDVLQAAGCSLVPIGPHAPGDCYIRDPFGIVFDVVARQGKP